MYIYIFIYICTYMSIECRVIFSHYVYLQMTDHVATEKKTH